MVKVIVEAGGIEEAISEIDKVGTHAEKMSSKANARANDTAQEITKLEANSGKVIRKVGEGIQQSWNVLQQYLSIAGISIKGVSGAVIRSVFAGLSSLQALATAQLSNPFTAFMAFATFAAVNVASVKAIRTEMENERQQQNLEVLQNITSKGYVTRI